MDQSSIPLVVANAMIQLKTRMTVVRIAVARFESMSPTPIFARIAVAPAKNAESTAQKSHSILRFMRGRGKEWKDGRMGWDGSPLYRSDRVKRIPRSDPHPSIL